MVPFMIFRGCQNFLIDASGYPTNQISTESSARNVEWLSQVHADSHDLFYHLVVHCQWGSQPDSYLHKLSEMKHF